MFYISFYDCSCLSEYDAELFGDDVQHDENNNELVATRQQFQHYEIITKYSCIDSLWPSNRYQ